MGGNKSEGIFSSWLKNFVSLVFMQSFHAIFLMMILRFISALVGGNIVGSKDGSLVEGADITNYSKKQGLLSILAIGGLMALLKFEKMIKNMFGIQDSKFVGGLGENLTRGMAGIKSAMAMGSRTMEPFKKSKEAQGNLAAARRNTATAQRRLDAIKAAGNAPVPAQTQGTLTNATNSTINEAGSQTYNLGGNNNTGLPAGEGATTQLSADAINRLIMALENNANAIRQGGGSSSSGGGSNAATLFDAQEALNKAKEDEAKAERDAEAWRKKRVTRLATTVAASAMGVGATENLSDAVTFANLADKPMDWYTDRVIDKDANINVAKRLKSNVNENYIEAVGTKGREEKRLAEAMSKLEEVETKHRTAIQNENLTDELEANYKREKNHLNKVIENSRRTIAEKQSVIDNASDDQKAQLKIAQDFLNEIPESLVSSFAKTWTEMTNDSRLVKVGKRNDGRKIPLSLNTSFGNIVKREVRDATSRITGRRGTPRSIDDEF